jgi:hypothetical protein
MHSPKASARETYGRWTVNISGIVQLVLIAFLMAALFALDRYHASQPKSILVRGTIQDTRIIADCAVETKWGSQLTWRAEYKVAYSVANREYMMWGDSGARGESTADVQLALAQAHRSCWVRYDSQDPAASVADCR